MIFLVCLKGRGKFWEHGDITKQSHSGKEIPATMAETYWAARWQPAMFPAMTPTLGCCRALHKCVNLQVSSVSVRVLEVLKALGHTLLQKGQK